MLNLHASRIQIPELAVSGPRDECTRMSLVISPAGILIPVSGKWRDNGDTCVAVNPNLCRPSSRCRGLCRKRSHCWRHQRIGDNLPPRPQMLSAPQTETAGTTAALQLIARGSKRWELPAKLKHRMGELDNIFFVVSVADR